MLERDGRDKVLIVLHQDHSTPGRVGRASGATRLRPRHSPPEPRRAAALDARRARRRNRLRRTDERQRRHSTGSAARSTGSPCRSPKTSRCSASALARRCSPPFGRPGVHLSRQAQRNRLLPGHADVGRGPPVRRAVPALRLSLALRRLRAAARRAAAGGQRRRDSQIRPSLSGGARWRCSSTRRSPTR